MGTYLNPGKQKYWEAVNSKIYVDKTEMISFLNSVVSTEQKYVSVSRPRRFGKSMAVNMLCAYYGRDADSRALFAYKKLSQMDEVGLNPEKPQPWDIYLNKFDVIRIIMTDFIKKGNSLEDSLKKMQKIICRDLKKQYPEVDYYDGDDLPQTMADVYAEYQRQFVIVIDEWDAIFRIQKDDKEGQTDYLNFLRDWLKDKEYIALAYMTGILPIKKYGEHSALNMFQEYSMTAPRNLARYTGFTEDEVKSICSEQNLNYSAMKEWYDGYRLSTLPSAELVEPEEINRLKATGEYREYEIYSPLSVVNAALYRRLENYWNKTETYEALAEYIRMDYDGLKEAVALLMNGGRIPVDLGRYQNDMTTFHSRDDVMALLIHLGYLGYDDVRGEVFIPNRELLDEFRNSTRSEEWIDTFESFRTSQELLKATWACDADQVAELLEEAHNRAGNKTYHDETALSYAIQLAYYSAQKYYTEILELDSGKGYADIVYLPSPQYPEKPALLIELKYDRDADTAMAQILRQKYPARLEHYRGNLLLVGINYKRELSNKDPLFKHHSCTIEKA
ncbi:MAG: AAA family ATPase [Blautia sp.]|nr:AAA family ATPase [Blautia sp.]